LHGDGDDECWRSCCATHDARPDRVAIGVGLSLLVSRALASLLLGMRPTDPISFAAAALLLIAVAFIGTYLPAHRASRFDPLIAFRQP
jgi:putative ABC transport system permease protein